MKRILALSAALMIFGGILTSCRNDSVKPDKISVDKDKSYSDKLNNNEKVKKLNTNYSVSHMNFDSNLRMCSDIAYCNGRTYIMGNEEDFGESRIIKEIDLVSHEKKEYIINQQSSLVNNVLINDGYLYFTAYENGRDDNGMSFSNMQIFKFNLSTGQNECTATLDGVSGECFLLINKVNNELYFIDMWGSISVYDTDLNLRYTDDATSKIADYLGTSDSFTVEDAAIDENGCAYISVFFDKDYTQNLVKLDNNFNAEFSVTDDLNDLGEGGYKIASLKDGKIAAYSSDPDGALVDIIDISSGKVSERYEIETSDDELCTLGKCDDSDWIKVSNSLCEEYILGSNDRLESYNLDDEIYDILNSFTCAIDNGKLYSVEEYASYAGGMINIFDGDKCSKVQNKSTIMILDNGNVVEWDNYTKENAEYSPGIRQYTLDGNETDPIYPDGIDISEDTLSGVPQILGCGENILIHYNNKYIIYNTQGEIISESELSDSCLNVILAESDNESFIFYLKDNEYYIYNPANDKTNKMDLINETMGEGNTEIYKGDSFYDLYFLSEYSFYGYDVGSQTLTEIISDTRTLGIDDIRKIITIGDDGTLLCMTGDEEDNIYVLTPSENGDTRTAINVAYVNAQCRDQVQKFNDSNDEYLIKVTDYSDFSALNLDIAAGRIPDILISDGSYYVKELAEKNMFTDMSAFFENDKEIKTDDYLENILFLYKSDDIVYQVFPGFGVKSVFTDDKTTGIRWDYNGFLDYAQKYGSKALYGKYDKCNMLLEFMPYYFSDFVDIQNKSCDFDNDTFRRMLDLINTQECYENYDKGRQFLSISDGLGAAYVSTVKSFTDFESLNEGNKTKISIKGFPGKEEGHSEISPQICFSISEQCENKEAAWSFVRTFFLNDYQDLFVENKMEGIPVNNSAYDALLQKQKSDGMKNYSELDNTIKSIKKSYDSVDSINKIIAEETAAYFEGQASVDDVIAALQSKVKLYLNEKY